MSRTRRIIAVLAITVAFVVSTGWGVDSRRADAGTFVIGLVVGVAVVAILDRHQRRR
ncbi:MAG TPA: hypothetical protein VFJ85_00255 [Acidimicrobiales bacterium]|nr:hypothetical protein [Acidimicrobiales bacterium]